jgi:predicted dehydrogenase
MDPRGEPHGEEQIMKKTENSTDKAQPDQDVTRREFVKTGALATAGIITGAPAFLRGQNLNNKMNIAFIASGGRATASMGELTLSSGRGGGGRGAAAAPAPAPAGRGFGGRGRGAAAAAEAAAHPDENVTVICDVNENALDSAGLRFPQAKKYTDYRKVFDSPNDFDAVVVATPEHHHVFATYLALTMGKHVYCEKPLTYNIWEARLIRETAAKFPNLSTQMGNQGHASAARRTIREILQTGVIGPVHEVHVWADRAWGLQWESSADRFDRPHGWYSAPGSKPGSRGVQIVNRFKETMPIPPKEVHNGPHTQELFDLWVGPAPARPYHATYFPGPRWYRWWDVANGTMSDLGSHDNDVPYTVLDIWREIGGRRVLAPATVESISNNLGPAHPELAPATLRATYEYPAVGSQPALKLVWHQGESKPTQWTEEMGGRSCLFIGEKGMLTGNGQLLPLSSGGRGGGGGRGGRAGGGAAPQGPAPAGPFADFQPPPETIPRSPGHWVEWVQYAKGQTKTPPGSNFQYSGWTTEANHLGNVAYRTGKKIEWDYVNLRATNAPEAAPFIKRPQYRKGWTGILPGS